jgi:hypothetical protein
VVAVALGRERERFPGFRGCLRSCSRIH